MKFTNTKKETESVKRTFDIIGISYKQKSTNHLLIGEIVYGCISGKWYDPIGDVKGVGINSFLNYLKENKIC